MDTASPVDALTGSSAFTKLTRYTKAFDLFTVMGVSTKELIHSNILATFLDEHQAHGLGAQFRDALVSSLQHLPCTGTRLTSQILHATPGTSAKVARELAHIDVLLNFPSLRLVVAIENKIWAADQHQQVARYQQALCDLYPHYEHRALLYLTPTGRESPTIDRDSSVPVYFQSYGEMAALLARHQASANPNAAHFIGQFITHVEKTMSGNTELKQLCLDVFEQNEEAYEHLVRHHEYCKAKKMEKLFATLQTRLTTDAQFCEWAAQLDIKLSVGEKNRSQYDLDLRLRQWPEGIWIKVYKHSWFGVFPYLRAAYLEAMQSVPLVFALTPRSVPDWSDLYFASQRFLVKEDRCVLERGDKAGESEVNEALARVYDCIEEINQLVAGIHPLTAQAQVL